VLQHLADQAVDPADGGQDVLGDAAAQPPLLFGHGPVEVGRVEAAVEVEGPGRRRGQRADAVQAAHHHRPQLAHQAGEVQAEAGQAGGGPDQVLVEYR
jgi:hypothetical protein